MQQPSEYKLLFTSLTSVMIHVEFYCFKLNYFPFITVPMHATCVQTNCMVLNKIMKTVFAKLGLATKKAHLITSYGSCVSRSGSKQHSNACKKKLGKLEHYPLELVIGNLDSNKFSVSSNISIKTLTRPEMKCPRHPEEAHKDLKVEHLQQFPSQGNGA